jgi:co-chaperonin GroES (HSP10)
VLVKPYEPEQKRSLIELPASVQEKMTMVDTRVIVVELGPACWPNEPPRAAPGDKVIISKFAGSMTRGTRDGELYRVVNDNDIYLAIIEESQNG